MKELQKEIYYDGLFANEKAYKDKAVSGSIRVTNKKLEKVLRKSYNKFKSQLEWEEFLGSAMMLVWFQIDRFDGDWDAILAGDTIEENKLMSAISKAVYFGTIEVANPNSKFMGDGIVEIEFASLNEVKPQGDDFALELQDTEELESYFSAKEGCTKTPFQEWLEENIEGLLTESQYEFYQKYMTCLDNTREEVEGKTGIPHKQISKRVSAIKKRVEKGWSQSKSFEHTYLYKELVHEKQYMEELLDQDFDHLDFIREIAGDMMASNKLGNLILDNLSHSQLIEVNTWKVNSKTVYKIVDLMIQRIEQIEQFIDNEKKIYERNNHNKQLEKGNGCKDYFKHHIQPSDCLVFDSEGSLLDVIPAKRVSDKSKVKKLDGFGHME